jgi:hypothetical protein
VFELDLRRIATEGNLTWGRHLKHADDPRLAERGRSALRRTCDPFAEQTERDAERDVERGHQNRQCNRRECKWARRTPKIDRRGGHGGDAAKDEAEFAGEALSSFDQRLPVLGRLRVSARSRDRHATKPNARRSLVTVVTSDRRWMSLRVLNQRALNHLSSMTSTGFEYDWPFTVSLTR